jgi:hypothetical protein
VSEQYEEAELTPETIRLGDRTVQLDPENAQAVREAFENLAGQYAGRLEEMKRQQEEYQRQVLQYAGTQGQQVPQMPDGFNVPDPDMLFSNKNAWTDEFQRALESKIGAVQGNAQQMVQGAVQAFQQELNRRDQAEAARKFHDEAMSEMLQARGLSDHTRIVQAIYHEQYKNLEHLPLKLALDRIGQLAQEEIDRIRAGERWTVVPNANSSVAPRPPAMLRSVKKAPTPVQTAPQTPEYDPSGSLGMMGKIIKKYQAQSFKRTAA